MARTGGWRREGRKGRFRYYDSRGKQITDPYKVARIEELVTELKKRYTIVIVTHNMQQAARISDVTAFFYKGYIVEVGPTTDLFTSPKQKQTEDYLTGRFG